MVKLALTVSSLVLNRKLGLELTPDDIMAVAGTGVGYAGVQSIVNAVKMFKGQ